MEKTFFFFLWVHWGDLIEQIKKSVIYTLNKHLFRPLKHSWYRMNTNLLTHFAIYFSIVYVMQHPCKTFDLWLISQTIWPFCATGPCHPMRTFSRLRFGPYLPLQAKFPNIRVWSNLPSPTTLFKIKGLLTFATWATVLNTKSFLIFATRNNMGQLQHLPAVSNMCKLWLTNHIWTTFATQANNVKFSCFADIFNAALTSSK